MKVVILAGGYGTRLSEETNLRPKPMAEIGGKPILWHIMKNYSHYGFNEFIILLGYKGYCIKEYFANYFLHQSDITFDLLSNKTTIHNNSSEPWKVTLLDTGLDTMTGGRIKRAKEFINNEPFHLTYGDGVSDVNLKDLLIFHKSHKRAITVTAVQPEGKFGSLDLDDNNKVNSFMEKPKGDGSWINGGFFICEPKVLDYIKDDSTVFEKDPVENLSLEGEMYTFKHKGFWKCMDTLRDKNLLNELWEKNNAKWKIWK
jgi:glucose-1-phosphate cytidylyltransferase